MKIIFISTGCLLFDDYPNPSHGTSIQIWGIAKELANRGHDVYIIARGNVSELKKYNKIKILTIKIDVGNKFILDEMISSWIFSFKSANIIKKIKPDVVYLRDRTSAFFPVRLHFPTIYTINSEDAFDYYKNHAIANNKANAILFYYQKYMEKMILSRVSFIIALNNYMYKYLIKKGYHNVAVINGGINPDDYFNDGDDNFILYAGRIDWNRRVDLLINIFSKISNKFDINLKIIGSSFYPSQEDKRLKKLVKSIKLEDRIQFIPWLERNTLKKYMARCSIFVLPSIFESHGNVILEAMSSSKSVISSDANGPSDLITHGYDGFLFKKNNPKQLQEFLELCLSDKKLSCEIGKNARTTIINKFTWNIVANKYLNIYFNLINKNNKRSDI
jgi:glycosyltransferase involved in cell wall biosynthesis